MKIWKRGLLLATAAAIPLYLTSTILFSLNVKMAHSADAQMLKPRVPADKLAEVKGLKNIVSVNTKTLSEAKEIFFGKGVCHTCHGEKGKGDGPAAASFNPPPRDFTDIEWQKTRTDGEIYWAITKGTEYGMIPFEDMLSEREKWALVNYIRQLGGIQK